MTAIDWMQRGACRDADPELFFPPSGWRAVDSLTLAWCDACPVTTDCLTYAMARPELLGVWGGTTHQQRAHVRATAKAQAAS